MILLFSMRISTVLEMCRIDKYAERAAEEALNSPLMYQFGAIVINGGKQLSIGYNNGKKHAEVHALEQLSTKQTKGAVLIVVRVNKSGLAMSKPCVNCHKRILDFGIKRVYYSTTAGIKKYKC